MICVRGAPTLRIGLQLVPTGGEFTGRATGDDIVPNPRPGFLRLQTLGIG
ncbi:hypothetical protein [Brevibacillus brevis]|nr:hypothetical protein [Brevibacillus brevis]MBY0083725.1 hypothetical protein [Brevibacillus brevis]